MKARRESKGASKKARSTKHKKITCLKKSRNTSGRNCNHLNTKQRKEEPGRLRTNEGSAEQKQGKGQPSRFKPRRERLNLSVSANATAPESWISFPVGRQKNMDSNLRKKMKSRSVEKSLERGDMDLDMWTAWWAWYKKNTIKVVKRNKHRQFTARWTQKSMRPKFNTCVLRL